ncbi:N-acetylmuramoyl-L-alanine amidase, partial [Bacteroides thetaiotaomicron]
IRHRGFRDIGYHFYITRDGEIHPGRPLEKVGAHCRNHNAHSIGICYEGGLDADGRTKDTRTLEQRGSLLALIRELRKRFPKALIVGHHDLNPMKECPCFRCVEEYKEL